MSNSRKRAKLSWFEIKATVALGAILIAYAIFAMWLGYQSTIYHECMNQRHGRGAMLFCSVSLLGGGPFEYLVFVGQWAPLAAFLAWLTFHNRGHLERLRQRRLKDRARRAARKAASQSSNIQSE